MIKQKKYHCGTGRSKYAMRQTNVRGADFVAKARKGYARSVEPPTTLYLALLDARVVVSTN